MKESHLQFLHAFTLYEAVTVQHSANKVAWQRQIDNKQHCAWKELWHISFSFFGDFHCREFSRLQMKKTRKKIQQFHEIFHHVQGHKFDSQQTKGLIHQQFSKLTDVDK